MEEITKDSRLVNLTRLAFLGYGIFVVAAVTNGWLTEPEASFGWFVYLTVIYILGEQFYGVFKARGIDLSFAFPMVFAVYILNLISIFVKAQEKFPLINRAEHFATFVLISYAVWIFFLKYLPQNVWQEHPYYTAILVFSIVSTFGVVNEIIELILDHIYHTSLIGNNRFDTPLDLLMNSLGAGAFLATELILGVTDRKVASKKA